MGVTSSRFQKKNKLQIIDFGSILPLGLYEKKNDDYDLQVVRELILSKKISPFYKGLSDPLTPEYTDIIEKPNRMAKTKKRASLRRKPKNKAQDYKNYLYKNEKRLYSILYNDSVECPICFLYYPANINFTRCCDQPICTECFVQIKKRPADASTSTSSDIVACPYCMTDNFGIIYHCPPSSPTVYLEKGYKMRSTTSGISQHQQSKRKSIESDHPNVVLTDHVRLKPSKAISNKSDMRASSLQLWFQSSRNNSNVTSLDRYLSTIRLEDMSIQDIVAIESIRQSLLDNENNRHRPYHSYIL